MQFPVTISPREHTFLFHDKNQKVNFLPVSMTKNKFFFMYYNFQGNQVALLV